MGVGAVKDYSVKAAVSIEGESIEVHGPWESNPEDAIRAFAEVLKGEGLAEQEVIGPFLAIKCEPSLAPCWDGKGDYYYTPVFPALREKLGQEGVKVAPWNISYAEGKFSVEKIRAETL